MLTKLKQQWTQLKHYPPGQRFQRRYEARHKTEQHQASLLRRLVVLGIALVFTIVGIILVFIPGPAILFFFLAGAVLAEESLAVARLLDWLEVRIRRAWTWLRRWWFSRSVAARVLVSVSIALLTGASAYLSYQLLF